ncbi:MAG: acetyl-CoA carboxylase biotin carboxyl carrier protein [Lachnospiraceae bacterium]|nr:acetyl-CoA carboxylase biotin carboxyl carrier protein [Lachnospiraceae bacterium]
MTIQEIEEIMGAFEKHGLTEFSYANGKESIKLKKVEREQAIPAVPAVGTSAQGGTAAADVETIPSAQAAGKTAPAAAKSQEGTPLTAPLAGVFYRAAKPDEEPYVEVGSEVKKGQTIGLIEAMKMMSEIPAPCDGYVASFAANNGDFVEYGQTLLVIKEK